jgi:hypothetical protein
MTKLQTIIDNAAAVGGSQIDVGMWAMIFEMVLEFMQACSERNSPEAIEGFVRADDTRQIEAMGRRELRKQFREEYGERSGSKPGDRSRLRLMLPGTPTRARLPTLQGTQWHDARI